MFVDQKIARGMAQSTEQKSGIALVAFGTSVEEGLPGVLKIKDRFVKRFPRSTIKLIFTSNIIRRIWQERAAANRYREIRATVPQEIRSITTPPEAIHELKKSRIDELVIQPVQMAPAVQEVTAREYLGGLESNLGDQFDRIAVGRPAMGLLDSNRYSYKADIVALARALSRDLKMARQEKAALFYLGHGNKESATEKVYQELLIEIQNQYPDVVSFMSMVEGGQPVEEIIREMQGRNVTRVILKPFMIVAGDHVRKDMIGEGERTLQTMLETAGIDVKPVLTGLGEIPEFAEIFVQHALDSATDAGIMLA